MHEYDTKLNKTLQEINGLLDQVYKEHSKNTANLINECHEAHVSFHRFMCDISQECDEYIAFFNNVIEEFTVAKINEKFDSTFTEELKLSTAQILK